MHPVVNKDLCIGCGACANACPSDAIEIEETARISQERCNSCGVCMSACPRNAIRMVSALETTEVRGAQTSNSEKLRVLRQKMERISNELKEIEKEIKKM